MQTGISESVVSATWTIGFVVGVGYILHLIYTEINICINIWIVDIHIHSLYMVPIYSKYENLEVRFSYNWDIIGFIVSAMSIFIVEVSLWGLWCRWVSNGVVGSQAFAAYDQGVYYYP